MKYVEFVTGFSILKITCINGEFHFYDSADTKQNTTSSDLADGNATTDQLLALTPYSVFIAAKTHMIGVLDTIVYAPPTVTGIDELSIESDFIIRKDIELASEENKFLYLS